MKKWVRICFLIHFHLWLHFGLDVSEVLIPIVVSGIKLKDPDPDTETNTDKLGEN